MHIKLSPADIECSKAVRMSRNHTCEHCGRQDGKMEAAHVYSRKFKSVRWDITNILCLCFRCHLDFTGAPLDFERWLRGYMGEGMLDILNEKRNRIQKDTKAYRQEVAKHYRQQIKLMESGQHELISFQ